MKARIAASIMLWIAAVASVASIAWLAIDAAGRQVTASPVSASLPTQPPTVTATGSPAATGSARPTGPARSTSAAKPSTRPPARPSTPPTSARPDGSRSGAAGGDVALVSGSYSTTGGRVRVGCRGPVITLDGGYAQPASGWSVRVQAAGPRLIQVVFDLRNQQALLVVSICADGHPQFDQDRIEAGGPGHRAAGWPVGHGAAAAEPVGITTPQP